MINGTRQVFCTYSEHLKERNFSARDKETAVVFHARPSHRTPKLEYWGDMNRPGASFNMASAANCTLPWQGFYSLS